MSAPLSLSIRAEKAGDEEAIHSLTKAAFAPMPFSNGSEPYIVDALRQDGDLTLSLVALQSAQGSRAQGEAAIAGHIAFSPVTIADGTPDWYGLGPVSAKPGLQRMGIGSALIREGLAQIERLGARGVVLLGSTEYYPRFGFSHDPRLTYAGAPPEFFQQLAFADSSGRPHRAPAGEVHYAKAFEAPV